MYSRTWVILSVAFGTLIALIALFGLGAQQRATQIYGEISHLGETHRRQERLLSEIRTELHLSGVLVRDYLLDPAHIAGARYREDLRQIRNSMAKELAELARNASEEDLPALKKLSTELDRYWDSLDPLFEWTPRQKLAMSSLFLRQQVLPRRDAVLAVAREIRELNQARHTRQRELIERKWAELPVFVARMLTGTLLLGLVVAGLSIFRILRLEHKSERERRRAESAEKELRHLSLKLVKAQEDERRHISRELHDEVGQMLTALRMELRNLDELRKAPEEEFRTRLGDTKQLSEQALRAVRDMAMGLRPSMLDDLGLGPALEWQARDFSRRCGVPVNVQIDGTIDGLPDSHRTCVYRVVQEALTNCARHARANDIRINAHGQEHRLLLMIQDDGAGFDARADAPAKGLGLIGIKERVNELGGKVTVISQPGKGTVLSVELPVPGQQAASV